MTDNSKFLCGDSLTIFDFRVAGLFTDFIDNPKCKLGNQFPEQFAKDAPERLKTYIDHFKSEMKGYLDKRPDSNY